MNVQIEPVERKRKKIKERKVIIDRSMGERKGFGSIWMECFHLRHGGHHIPELWREGVRKEWCECNQGFIGGIKELRLLLRHILTFLGKVRLYAKRENVAGSIRDNEVECLKESKF